MKARARKKMMKKVASRSRDIVSQAKPAATKAAKKLSATSSSTFSTLAGAAASLIGSAVAIAKTDFAHDIFDEIRSYRRKDNTNTVVLVAIGAGVAVAASGIAFFLGTERGMKLREEVVDLAKPYLEKAKETASEVRSSLIHSTTNHAVNGTSAPS